MLEELTGIDVKSIRLDDPETMRLFKTPEALGIPLGDPIIGCTGSIAVPEFGTKFTREMLVDTKPDKMSTLIRLSGFLRYGRLARQRQGSYNARHGGGGRRS
jgi:DNA polymerase-3 subunit alpha (Gram-positive type)